jgi:hypothetical protein
MNDSRRVTNGSREEADFAPSGRASRAVAARARTINSAKAYTACCAVRRSRGGPV